MLLKPYAVKIAVGDDEHYASGVVAVSAKLKVTQKERQLAKPADAGLKKAPVRIGKKKTHEKIAARAAGGDIPSSSTESEVANTPNRAIGDDHTHCTELTGQDTDDHFGGVTNAKSRGDG